MDYFALLGLTPAFDLDLGALEKAYFAAQRQYHPDKFASKPVMEKQAAMQRSVDINNAYKTLKEPLSRAQYLLKQSNIIVGTEADSVKPTHALLTEVMGWREEDIAKEVLEPIRQQSIASIAKHYTNGAWNDMAQETLRLGYIQKTLDDHR